MLCEHCKKRTATVFYNENINGQVRAFSLCGECAAKLRERGEIHEITSMTGSFADPFADLQSDLFGGFFGIPFHKAIAPQKKCPGCGSIYADVTACGRVGCPTCYQTFREELAPTIHSIHGTTSHTGSVPARYRAKQERADRLKQLKAELRDAVNREDYEKAASLRDEIRALQAEKAKEDK